jgi:hypothetical protein
LSGGLRRAAVFLAGESELFCSPEFAFGEWVPVYDKAEPKMNTARLQL